MAVYDPPQPMWKRMLAGTLDFLLAAIGFGYVLFKNGRSAASARRGPGGTTTTEIFSLRPLPSLLLLALIITYFIGLGRPGGTVFQPQQPPAAQPPRRRAGTQWRRRDAVTHRHVRAAP